MIIVALSNRDLCSYLRQNDSMGLDAYIAKAKNGFPLQSFSIVVVIFNGVHLDFTIGNGSYFRP